ncbi:non-specific lipid transfer protein GPI-anchored 10 [Corylus avellana]|uniref:non-specific lipid transfer protein GPI-anchored 10 n=1 Tax=Corylus avellana TaxID=13451 RepID=UPI00286B4160|nr:non-specific lipid transfer protein GPI-anchored 10 [Corylus avellana]
MAFLPIAIPTLILLLLISLPTATLSQDPSSSGPSIAQCAPSLLPLAPCAPFVQGTAQSPSQPCCSNLKQLYTQEPHCLCLLLNDTTFNSFPINNTLALQLPLLCSLQVNISPCSGINLPSNTSFGTNTNSTVGTNTNTTVAASPTVQVQPRTNIMGSGIGRSTSTKLRGEGGYARATTLAAFLLTILLY